jgi:hypothetical protein
MNFEKPPSEDKASFETPFERVIGGSEEDKATARKILQGWLESTEGDIPQKYELPKTQREVEIIQGTEDRVMHMAQAYSGSPKPMPLEKVHIIAQDKGKEVSRMRFIKGWHSPISQFIVVERQSSELRFTEILAHELFHQAGYKSAQIYEKRRWPNLLEKKKSVNLKRSGLAMLGLDPEASPDDSVEYFNALEEGIVGAMTDRFVEQERSNPQYAKAFEDMDKIKEWIEAFSEKFPQRKNTDVLLQVSHYFRAIDRGESILNVLQGERSDNDKLKDLRKALIERVKSGELISSSSPEEQKILDNLFEELISKGVYENREEAFDAFATANFNGNLLPLGKQIDGVLGRGAFREIAERFKEKPKGKLEEWFERSKRFIHDQTKGGSGSK